MFKFWLRSPLFDAAGDGSGAGGGSGSFDSTAFQTSLMAEVNKAINGAMKGLKTDFTKALEGLKPSTAGSGSGDGSGDGAGSGSGDGSNSGAGKADAATLKLERQLKELQTQLVAEKTARETTAKDASEKERLAAIRETLSGHQFATDGLRADAFRYFRDEIKRGDDGELIGGDSVPLKDYIAETYKTRTDWQPPKDAGSAGARSGKSSGSAKALNLEDIKPGMKAEDLAALSAQIQAALQGQA